MAAGRGNTKAVLAEVEFLRKVHPDTTRPGQPKDSLQTALDRIEAAATPDPDERTDEWRVLLMRAGEMRAAFVDYGDPRALERAQRQRFEFTWITARVPLPDPEPEVEEIEGEVE